MDPLALQGPGIVEQRGRAVWIVGIADLLMVTDVLNDAASFHHYARTRAAMNASGPLIYMESDALGGYLIDRLAPVRAQTAERPDATVVLGYSSGEINNFFTAVELGTKASKPTTGIPSAVADALTSAACSTTGRWVEVVDEIIMTTPATWKRWRSFARRHKTGGQFALSEDLELTVGRETLIRTPSHGRTQLQVPAFWSKGGRRQNR